MRETTIGIVVSTETEKKILERLESGKYESAEEVIVEALRLLDEHDQMQSLRAAVGEGLEGETDDVSPKPADDPA